jgi:asparagine synthase (glutamine-hydrolysing)
MSAIFGLLDLGNKSIDSDWITSMQEDLIHRGPDGQGLYCEQSLVLGHMLLKVTPESVYDKSPYEEDGFVITANARLDERETLMNRLNIAHEERTKTTDSILLLRSYRKWGKDFVKDIYGDFSFAIWDKEKKELFCARDQMGIKPFLYYFQDNRFVFSTELKAIVKLPFVNSAIDNYYLRDRALAICDQPQKTSWKNIFRLTSACTLAVSNSKLFIKQYWQPKYKRNKKFKTEEDSTAALNKLLEIVITDHTRVIGEVGAPLSGGLDSSIIVCLAARKLNQAGRRITTASSIYTPALKDPHYPDEMEYISEVIQQEHNIDPTFVYHSDHKFIDGLNSKFNKHYALVNGTYYVDEALYNQFHIKSIRRVLSGYLGDSTVTNISINPIPILFTSGRFITLYKLILQYRQNENQAISAFLKHCILTEFTPKFFQKAWSKYKGNFDSSRNIDMLPLKCNSKQMLTLQKKVLRTFQISNLKIQDIAQNIWPNHLYLFDEDWDCGSSHHQIEMTYPLCDRRLVELLLQLPVEHFYAGGRRRGLIRKAMIGILPEKIRNRKNKGSYAPGYPQLIKKEIKSITDFIQDGPLSANLDNLLDLKKLKIGLENLSESKNEDSFTYKSWTLIELIMWTYFNQWFVNIKLNRK